MTFEEFIKARDLARQNNNELAEALLVADFSEQMDRDFEPYN